MSVTDAPTVSVSWLTTNRCSVPICSAAKPGVLGVAQAHEADGGVAAAKPLAHVRWDRAVGRVPARLRRSRRRRTGGRARPPGSRSRAEQAERLLPPPARRRLPQDCGERDGQVSGQHSVARRRPRAGRARRLVRLAGWPARQAGRQRREHPQARLHAPRPARRRDARRRGRPGCRAWQAAQPSARQSAGDRPGRRSGPSARSAAASCAIVGGAGCRRARAGCG